MGGGLDSAHSRESARTTFTTSSSLAGPELLNLCCCVAATAAAARGAEAQNAGLRATGATLDTAKRSMVAGFNPRRCTEGKREGGKDGGKEGGSMFAINLYNYVAI